MSNPNFPKLFESTYLGKLKLRNRLVMPPMTTGYARDGFVTDRQIDYYAERAQGGAGIIIVEDACVDIPLGKHGYHDIFINDDQFIPNLFRLAKAIKDHGARAAIQLNHAGRMAGKLRDGQLLLTDNRMPVAPSAIAYPVTGFVTPQELTAEDIALIEDRFAEAARRAKEAGFDIVFLHCSHQFLIEQFLSPLSNKRRDIYGGSFPRRLWFLLEIIRKTRQKVGNDFPIACRISGEELLKGGLTSKDSIKIALRLEKAGVNGLSVSHGFNPSGRPATVLLTEATMKSHRGELVHLAEPIAKAVSIPVMTVGSIITPDLAEQIVQQGKSDLICIGKGLISDPDWPKKAQEGKQREIRHCIACGGCLSGAGGGSLNCIINPTVGFEREFRLMPVKEARSVLVAGGGPAGMEAARVAAIRGHKVRLYEKDVLGGQLNLACLCPGKDEFELFLSFERENLNKLGVIIENKELTPEIVHQKKPDAVIVATGAFLKKPRLSLSNSSLVTTAWEVLKTNLPRNKYMVVIGGGQLGAETAERLATAGNRVVIIERSNDIAGDMLHLPFYRNSLLFTLRSLGIRVLSATMIEDITESGVLVKTNGRSFRIEADLVIWSQDVKPDRGLAIQLNKMGVKCHLVGDCNGIGGISRAVKDGFRIGMEL